MRDYARHAVHVLRVYRDRGTAALEALESGDSDKAEEWLGWRKAAFENFRTADALAMRQGVDIGRDPETQRIWEEIQSVDERLARALESACMDAGRTADRIRNSRNKLHHYRSGQSESNRFESSV